VKPLNGGDPQCVGGYCGEGEVLSILSTQQAAQSARIDHTDEASGRTLAAAMRAEQAAHEAHREASHARQSCDRMEAIICRPVNDALAKYQSDASELYDADSPDEPTSTSIQVPALAERRIRKEQGRKIKAVKQRNWAAAGLAIGGLAAGIFEALKALGLLK
jgi:hypothetical protein